MIDEETKQKLLKEFESFGNVYMSCLKVGIGRSTFYRWEKDDEEFKNQAAQAINRGRENMSEVAEHALLLKVKEKNMDAIKYVLSHTSPRYKQKQSSSVLIIHKTMPKSLPTPVKTLEDLIDDYDKICEEDHQREVERIKTKYQTTGIPSKTDGSAISEDELPSYEKYIEEYYKKKEIEEAKIINNITQA